MAKYDFTLSCSFEYTSFLTTFGYRMNYKRHYSAIVGWGEQSGNGAE
jgi:hypothetical protein